MEEAHREDINLSKADIDEALLFEEYPEAAEILLADRTTGGNIYWATNSYKEEYKDEAYDFFAPLTKDNITAHDCMVIRPRAYKAKEIQRQRTKDKAEVFTPSWVCNAQNNLIDEAWFGRKNVFNRENETEHTWEPTLEPIQFTQAKTWKDYVSDIRMEVTCGEAPYLVSRYDTVTGQDIPMRSRIGLLDRKLRVVSENTTTEREWLTWARQALKSTYGFEWQGDNLLLAREAVLMTFCDYYQEKFKHRIPRRSMISAARIISWNMWQMDGLTFGLPGADTKEALPEPPSNEPVQQSLFPDEKTEEQAEQDPEIQPQQRLCRIAKWHPLDKNNRKKEVIFKQIVISKSR